MKLKNYKNVHNHNNNQPHLVLTFVVLLIHLLELHSLAHKATGAWVAFRLLRR